MRPDRSRPERLRLAVEGSIEVRVEDPYGTVFPMTEATGGLGTGDWTYDRGRNSITFLEFMPEPLSKVVIRYTLLASAELVEDEE